MPTKEQLELAKQLRSKIGELKRTGMPDKDVLKVIDSLDLPLGLHLNVMNEYRNL